MSAQGWARRLVFFFVLMVTSFANLLFVPVDNDGDDSTPPVIFSFKFVAPGNASHSSRSQQNVRNATMSRPESVTPSISFSSTLRTAEVASPAVPITPLRC